MMQLPNCCLEHFKAWACWESYNTGWEGIPLDNCQWKEGVVIIVLASLNLTESHGVAVSLDPV